MWLSSSAVQKEATCIRSTAVVAAVVVVEVSAVSSIGSSFCGNGGK